MVEPRRHGGVFDAAAEAYDARRSGYPPEIVSAAVEVGGLGPGDRVVEVGSGTGKLTEELVACGLCVDAVEPGPNMIDVARRRVNDSDLVRFHLGRFEDVSLPVELFDAIFSGSAFHWVDPSVGWAKAAALLRPGGTLALLQPVGVRDEADGSAVEELHEAFARLAPEIAAGLPALRDLATIRAGVEARRENVSEVWSWLAHPGLAVPEAGKLFGPATLTTVRRVKRQSAEELWALFETTALYHRLTTQVRVALQAEDARIIERAGGTLRSTQLVALVTASRSSMRNTSRPADARTISRCAR
jgi:SAM-dependent methyltransferase